MYIDSSPFPSPFALRLAFGSKYILCRSYCFATLEVSQARRSCKISVSLHRRPVQLNTAKHTTAALPLEIAKTDLSNLMIFSTYSGKVTCATEWSQKKIEEKPVNPGMDGSYEKFFHDVSQQYEMPSFVTLFKSIKSGKKLPTPAHPFPPLPDSKSFNEISISR